MTYTFTYNAQPPSMSSPSGVYNVQVWNQNPPRDPAYGGDSGVADNGTHVVSHEIWINTQTTDPCSVGQTAAHEIGHGYGLAECPGCPDSSSVMLEGDNGYNSTNGTYGPTTCDNNTIRTVGQYTALPGENDDGSGGYYGGGGGDGGHYLGGGGGGKTCEYQYDWQMWETCVSYGGETDCERSYDLVMTENCSTAY